MGHGEDQQVVQKAGPTLGIDPVGPLEAEPALVQS